MSRLSPPWTRPAFWTAALALLAALAGVAAQGCKGLSPDVYNPLAPVASGPPAARAPARPGRRVYFVDEPIAPATVKRRPYSPIRPQDVPPRWRKSNLAAPMKRARALP